MSQTRPPDPLPSGTVTFLFTDIEGSTRLLHQLGDRYGSVLAVHNFILRNAFSAYGGVEVDTQGDSFFASFAKASDGVRAAVQAQRSLTQHKWPAGGVVRVRMALHTGEAALGNEGYIGIEVHRAARIGAAGSGGQILLSNTTCDLVENNLPEGIRLIDLGKHRFKDLDNPQQIYQVQGPDLLAEFPPIKSLDAFPNNLPIQPTPFLGRKEALAVVKKLLRQDEVRLLTLTGPGGTGKTRLGLQLAAEVLQDYPDGTYFVSLAGVRDPELLPSTISHALGVTERGMVPIQNILREQLRTKKMLLLLDNFEQIIAAASFVGQLLENLSGINVIVTSREPLRLRAEIEHSVQGLLLPPFPDRTSTAELMEYPAVALFVHRARAADPRFELTELNSSAVAKICLRLAGLPLAIELAAARVKMLAPDAILERMDHINSQTSLKLLSQGPRDVPERHRTIRSAIGWSYDLLLPEEKELFRMLSIFVGGFTLQAAEAVGGKGLGLSESLAASGLDIFEGVASLLEKNLLQRDDEYGYGPRYKMLELVREFGFDLLEAAGERQFLAGKHGEYFLGLALEAAPELEQVDQARWLERLDVERGNLRAAIRTLLGSQEAEAGLQICIALHLYWYMKGYLREGREYCEAALRIPGVANYPRLQAKLLDKTGHIVVGQGGQGDYTSAEGYIKQSLVIWRSLGDRQGIGDALANLAFVLYNQNKLEPAVEMYKEALGIQNKLGNRQGQADALSNLAFIAYFQGFAKDGQHLAAESTGIWEDLGDHHGVAWAYNIQGLNLIKSGQLDGARGSFHNGLSLAIENDIRWMVAFSLEGFALLAVQKDDLTHALNLAGAADKLRREAGESRTGIHLEQFDRVIGRARRSLDKPEADQAWNRFREMDYLSLLGYLREVGKIDGTL
jgi:predicted ATPase/class 3 adenylate cyclase